MSGMLLVCNTHTDVYFCNPQIGNTGVFSVKLNISLPFYSQLQDLSLQISKHFYIHGLNLNIQQANGLHELKVVIYYFI